MSSDTPTSLELSDEGIARFQIPNPYFEGQNNVYFIEGREPTLIDTGIGTAAALAELEGMLGQHGYRLNDVRKIFLTHKHIDHFGLACAIWERSGARVYVHEADHEEVMHFEERHAEVTERYRAFMVECGVPSETIASLTSLSAAFGTLGRSVPAEALHDGQRVALGDGELTVMHTPGHTRGSVCFQYEKLLFSGDHLLPDYTSNVGATDMEAAEPLSQYLSSLRKIQGLTGIEMTLPGHGEPMIDFSDRIATIEAHHRERSQKIWEILADGKPQSVYEIALRLFGRLRDHHVLLGCGEVHAHLAALISEGRVRRLGTGPGQYVKSHLY